MFRYFAGPVEIELIILVFLTIYVLLPFVASWIVAGLLGFYFKRFAPDTRLGKGFKAPRGITKFALCLFAMSFATAIILTKWGQPHLDRFGDVGVVLFTLTLIVVPIGTGIVIFNALNKRV